ncbi:MAG: hypothetical protein HPY61_04830 [Methanotrichaceae archaeon]|nr:hypothetical protein [Methanotrichaceae archaeon]
MTIDVDSGAQRLAEIKPPLEDQAPFLWDLVAGYEKGQIFLSALEMGIFNIAKEPKTVDQLAAELEADPSVTGKLLDVLVSMGVLCNEGDSYVTAPKMAPFLVEGEPYFARYLNFAKESRNQWADLNKVLKNGPASSEHKHEHKYDRETIDWIARGTMLGRLQATIQIIREYPEFQAARKMVDLGGGHGLFGIGFAQENPDLEVVIYDQPGVAEIAQEYIERYGLAERVKAVKGDYTKDQIGSDYDIAFEACSFGGNADQARSFYSRVAESLNAGGLFIAETFTLDDNRKAPLRSLIWDLKEQISGDGHMHLRTNSEIFSMFEKVGLRGESVIDLSEKMAMPMRLVVARKV